MFQKLGKHTLLFFFWTLLQVLIINHWELASGWFLPQPYVFFILALPFETPIAVLLLLCLGQGLVVDSFTDTPGLNASALLWVGMLRPWVLKAIAPRDGYEFGAEPTIRGLGSTWFINYVLILAGVHHLWLFILEFFGWGFTGRIIGTSLLSLIGTLGIGFIYQFFGAGSKMKR